VWFAGGGGGGASVDDPNSFAGLGGGSPGRVGGTLSRRDALPNSGGGGGGQRDAGHAGDDSGAGGSGVVILRMLTADYSGTTTGSPSVLTSGSDTILIFKGSGSYTA
jgi:hypothetical protein